MEYKSSYTIIIAIIVVFIFLLINGCGYFENDKIEYQINVVGNIKIQKQENTIANALVLQETNEISGEICGNCSYIFYDTINKKIFVECFLNESNSAYYQVDILNASSNNIPNAIKKEKIEKSKFDKIDKEDLKKWRFRD